MSSRLLRPLGVASLVSLLGALPAAPARAHGGIPVSDNLLFRGESLYVPTLYWGIFVRPAPDGPWSWICDEAINSFKLREVRLGGDGTLYATDLSGLTVSHDGGCSWEAVTGPSGSVGLLISQLDVNAVVPDPAVPARVWVSTVENGQSVLRRSEDAGRSFTTVYTVPGQASRGLAVSPDGRRLYITAIAQGAKPVPMLYVSEDGGASFRGGVVPSPLEWPRALPLAVDPRAPHQVYLVLPGDPTQVLLRADTRAGTFAEVLRLDRPIVNVAVDTAADRLLVATGDGIYSADGLAGVAGRKAGLSRAQCLSVHAGEVYACSWNYYPDNAAVARLSQGGASFSKVFQYADTKGVLSCPATSGVARTCPAVWDTYASLLGIEPPPPEVPMEEGCAVARRGPGGEGGGRGAGRGAGWMGGLLLLLGLLGRRATRRRATTPRGRDGQESS